MSPPAVAVTVDPVFRRRTGITGESVKVMSPLTVIAPVLASPITSLPALTLSSSASVRPS